MHVGKTGLLLINLGTPEATGYWSIRRYLKQFLSDKRVIDRSGIIWWLILNGIILTRRPKKSGRAYEKIWNHELDESPLKTVTRAQAGKLADRLNDHSAVKVDWAMRYGKPSLIERFARLKSMGCEQVVLFPLYPQYSGTTTGSALDEVETACLSLSWRPDIKTVPPYYENPTYIDALANSIKSRHANLSWEPEVTVISFHGLPQSFIDRGDPYQQHCERTAELLRQALGKDAEQMPLAYQSSSGRGVWLAPDLESMLRDLATNGVRNLCVVTPGFAADCVETLEEVEIRAAACFRSAGGENFSYIPCLNDDEASVDMLQQIALEQLEV